MNSQLFHKDCNGGNRMPIHPVTSLTAIKDLSTGKTLDEYLQSINHIYLPFKDNTKKETRLQVPAKLRRKGLWITYESCKGTVVTEWYNSSDFSNRAWGDSSNWVECLDKNVVEEIVQEATGWYKS